MRAAMTAFSLSFIGFACSGGDSESGQSSSSGGASPEDDDAPSACACEVEVNGEKQTIACGQQACVGSVSYRCDDGANAAESGDACLAPADPAAEDAGAEATTVPCEYHDFDAGKDVETCDAATQYCIRAYPSKLGPSSNNVCVPLPSDCTSCPCASNDAEAAWKNARNGTANCTGATIACRNTNGAIVVDCVK